MLSFNFISAGVVLGMRVLEEYFGRLNEHHGRHQEVVMREFNELQRNKEFYSNAYTISAGKLIPK